MTNFGAFQLAFDFTGYQRVTVRDLQIIVLFSLRFRFNKPKYTSVNIQHFGDQQRRHLRLKTIIPNTPYYAIKSRSKLKMEQRFCELDHSHYCFPGIEGYAG